MHRKEQFSLRKNNDKMLGWIWEFTKKVVTIVTVLYILSFIYSMYVIMHYINATSGYASCLDTMITEYNETFRNVVGGYLIKAGVENVSKIVSSKIGSVSGEVSGSDADGQIIESGE